MLTSDKTENPPLQGQILNKYGVRTESTGSVTIRVNCITQKRPEITKSDVVVDQVRKRKQQTALQLAKGKAANEAIHNVMGEFDILRRFNFCV